MEFEAMAQARYSVRKFSDQPVEQEKIDRLLAVCRTAPTAKNNQPQRILVIRSPEAVEKLKACTPCHFYAPLAFLVCYDAAQVWERPYDGYKSGEVDAAIVGTHLMLAAEALGLGTTWVMHYDPAAIRAQYSLPEHIMPVGLFPMGYPAADAKPGPMHPERKPLTQTVCYDSFA
ncbi:MAG: nitroreductase family protein [Oscillospiraceae bacterium]|nr:nitroreductase family protein [Oscillospiraceae bacterium]